MISNTKKRIIEFLGSHPDSSVISIIDFLGISKQATARHLSELLLLGLITKKGSPPKVFYSPSNKGHYSNTIGIESNNAKEKINDRFLTITPTGEMIQGEKAFVSWCNQRGFEVESKAQEYLKIVTKYDVYKNKFGLIDATKKVNSTYGNKCFLDILYYSEFSAYEVFGRTSIYSLLLYGKTAQNKRLITQLTQSIKEKVFKILIDQKIDAVGFIPPSVPRSIQLQKEFERVLNLPLPIVRILKVQGDVIVAQKTLKDPQDRIENSINSIVVDDERSFGSVLLIDDFVGSGASLNFTAEKIRKKIVNVQKVIGFAICGTPNGVINNSQKFEVLNEA